MARTFIINTKYKADGTDVLKTQSKMSKGFGRFAGQMADGNSMIGKSFSRMNKGIDNIAKIGLVALAGGLALATTDFIKFESAMAKVETIADETTMSFAENRKELLKMSNELGLDALTLAEAQYQAISAGVTDSAEALKFVGISSKAAIGGFTDTATAVDGLTSVLNAYGLESDKAQKISDQMIATQNFGKTTFAEMAATMGNTIPIASSLGVTTDQLFGSIAALTKQGIKTPSAFVGVKAALSNIIKPSEQASKLAKKLGLDFSASALKAKGFEQFLTDAATATGGSQEKMAKLFGSVEALNTVLALTKDGSKVFKDAIIAVKDSAGATDAAFEKMTNTLGFKFNKLKVRLTNKLIEIGDLISPFVNQLLDDLDKIDLDSVIKKFQEIDLKPIIAVFDGIKKGLGFLAKNWKILLALAGGIKGVAIAMEILTIAVQVFNIALKANVIGIIITAVFLLVSAIVWMALNWDKVTKALKIAWTWIANVGQKFTFLIPIFGLIIGGIIEVIKQFSKIKEAFQTEGIIAGLKAIGTAFLEGMMIPLQQAWELLKTFGSFMADTFGPILTSIGAFFVELGKNIFDAMIVPIDLAVLAIGFLVDKWGDLKTAFTDGSILNGVLNIGKTILSALLAPMQGFLELISNIPGIGNLTEGLSEKLANIRAGLEQPGEVKPSPNAFDPNQAFSLGRPETPTPITPLGEGGRDAIDINIRNGAGDNAEVKQKGNMPTGTKMNFVPALSL